MSRRIRVELTDAQARGLFAAAVCGARELAELGSDQGGESRKMLDAIDRAIGKLTRAYGRDPNGNIITGRPPR